MKRFLLLVASIAMIHALEAQLPNGSFAPDFRMTDLDGVEHQLYSYLDDGYTVIIDFSAVWCAPCWNYHNSGALEELYINHGPAGYPNVSESTTDDVMVFFIEGDQGSIAQLNGEGSGTQGNWVAGTPYPIIPTVAPNNNQVTSDYAIGYWPTVYMICPDRLVTENSQITTEEHYAAAQGCPEPSTNTYDAKIMDYMHPIGSYCGSSITPSIKLQNYGTENLTSVDVVSYINGEVNNTFNWSGDLGQYYYEEIDLNEIVDLPDGDHSWMAVLTNPNGQTDEDTSNDSVESAFSINSDGAEVVLDLLTDNYPTETSWDITLNGEIVAESDGISLAQHHYINTFCLDPDSCYVFTIYDAYGDGMSYGGVTGNIEIMWGDFVVLNISGDEFGSQMSEEFCIVEPASPDNDILTYSLPGETEPANIMDNFHMINVKIPDTVDVTNLVATFAISDLANIMVGDVEQISEVTANDFTDQVIYTVTAENGDQQDWTVTVIPVETTGINNISANNFSIYPNPAKEVLYIDTELKIDLVKVYNSVGKMVYQTNKINSGIDVSTYKNGLYFIEVRTENYNITKRIIVNK